MYFAHFAEVRKQVQLFPRPYTHEYSPATYAPQVGFWINTLFMRCAIKGTQRPSRGAVQGAAQSKIGQYGFLSLPLHSSLD
jgi:hypothetical protein